MLYCVIIIISIDNIFGWNISESEKKKISYIIQFHA